MGFAVFVLDYSLRGWFNDRISTAVEESVNIANSYLEEHKRSVSGQILAMANDINREAPNLLATGSSFDLYLTNQAGVRNLTEALVIDSTGRVIANSQFAYAVTFSEFDDDFLIRPIWVRYLLQIQITITGSGQGCGLINLLMPIYWLGDLLIQRC